MNRQRQTRLFRKRKCVRYGFHFLSLDMTKETDKSYTAFQKKFNDIIAKAKASGANTLVVHVRSHGDAYYPSSYYPWTHFLSGTQGVGPGYDPLAYMVSATHQAG